MRGWTCFTHGDDCFGDLSECARISVHRYTPSERPITQLEQVLGEHLTSYNTYEGVHPSMHAIRKILADPRLEIRLTDG